MTYETQVDAVHNAMQEPVLSDGEQLERRLDFIVRELDECMVLASNTETYPLIEGKAIELSQIQTRIQLIISFIISHQPNKFRIIQNG